MWLLPQGVVEELTWRREKRRCKLITSWESPPLGPTGAGRRRPGTRGVEGEKRGIGRLWNGKWKINEETRGEEIGSGTMLGEQGL